MCNLISVCYELSELYVVVICYRYEDNSKNMIQIFLTSPEKSI